MSKNFGTASFFENCVNFAKFEVVMKGKSKLNYSVISMIQMKAKHAVVAAAFAIAAMCLTACSSGLSSTDIDSDLQEASTALTNGDYDRAQLVCDAVYNITTGADSTYVTENQAGALGILFMRLAEHQNEAENVAEATTCVRYAFRLSTDSLKQFSNSLPLDDVRYFEVLRRLILSIDQPADLEERDIDIVEQDNSDLDEV